MHTWNCCRSPEKYFKFLNRRLINMDLILNLNGSIFCPFQGILDIAAQLTDTEPTLAQLIFKPVCELNTINDWVNIDDSLGDPTAIRAKEMTNMLCSLLKNKLISSLKLHIDLGDSPLTLDNFYTLLFLSESIDQLIIFFYISPKKITDLQRVINDLHGKENITIHYQHARRFASDATFVKTAEQLKNKRHQLLNQMGFSFYEPLNETVNGSISNLGGLINYAWSCLKSGSYQLGCHVFETLLAQSNLDGAVREEMFVHLQIIRFLSHQHHLVVDECYPKTFQFINQERIEHLYFITAFSATLTRNLSVAEAYFHKANINLTMPMTDEDSIYKLNLYALFHLIKGDSDTAFQLEIQLYRYIQVHHINATALHHVVFMNIARLYKKQNQYELSAEYYKKAYAQLSGGGFTPFDYINESMDLAILCEARGQMNEALFAWVKVAIHWLSCSNPYALAVRPRLVLCQEKVTDTLIPLSREKVNRFLLKKINYLSVCADIKFDNIAHTMFSFISNETKGIEKISCYAANNMIIYSCLSPAKQQSNMTPVETNLHQLISNLIKTSMNINDNQQLFVIETGHDCFYPQSIDECVALALLSKCTSCYYNGKKIDLDHHGHNVEVTLSPMIQSIDATPDRLRVVYKRSFLNKILEAPAEIELINKLNSNKNTDLSMSQHYCPDLLIKLFTKKIISFNFSSNQSLFTT